MMLMRSTTLGPRGRNAALGRVRIKLPGETSKLYGLADLPDITMFDSWWWKNRKLLAVGGAGVVGIGLLAIVGKVLR